MPKFLDIVKNTLTNMFEKTMDAYAPLEGVESKNLVVDFDDMNSEEEELYRQLVTKLMKNRLGEKYANATGDIWFAPICVCVEKEFEE